MANDPRTGTPRALLVTVPDPSLVVLVGAAGSGKSTLAARCFDPDHVLSSDSLREELAGDSGDQSVSRAAFALLHERAASRLRSGLLTVIDATSVDRRARAALLNIAAAARVPTVAIILALPDAVVLERNRQRAGRVVPDAVVRRQLARLRASLGNDALEHEGFDMRVRVQEAADLDRIVIRVARSA